MPDRKIQQRLQKFALDYLTRTSYGSDIEGYQSNQLSMVIAEVTDIHAAYPKLSDILNTDIVLIPSIDEVSDIQMANIGASAKNCMYMLSVGQSEIEFTQDGIIPIVQIYLAKVIAQAKDGCRKMADAKQTKEEIHKAVTERIDEYFKDLQKKEDLFNQHLKEAAANNKDAAKFARISVAKASQADKKAKKADKVLADAIASAEKANNTAKEAQKIANKAEKTSDNIVPNMLTVLGIFIGVVVAIMACYLSIVLQEDNAEAIALKSIPLAFMFAWMMGHVMVMAIFILLYMIAKLTDRRISNGCPDYICASKINHDTQNVDNTENYQDIKDDTGNKSIKRMTVSNISYDCNVCKNNADCDFINRLKTRFPYFFWINILFAIGYLVILAAHIIDTYYAEWFRITIDKYPGLFAILFFILISAGIARLLYLALKRQK